MKTSHSPPRTEQSSVSIYSFDLVGVCFQTTEIIPVSCPLIIASLIFTPLVALVLHLLLRELFDSLAAKCSVVFNFVCRLLSAAGSPTIGFQRVCLTNASTPETVQRVDILILGKESSHHSQHIPSVTKAGNAVSSGLKAYNQNEIQRHPDRCPTSQEAVVCLNGCFHSVGWCKLYRNEPCPRLCKLFFFQ